MTAANILARRPLRTCDEGVTRAGEFQPCEKPAVGLRYDPEDSTAYPVCAYHCRADMVPLEMVIAGAW